MPPSGPNAAFLVVLGKRIDQHPVSTSLIYAMTATYNRFSIAESYALAIQLLRKYSYYKSYLEVIAGKMNK